MAEEEDEFFYPEAAPKRDPDVIAQAPRGGGVPGPDEMSPMQKAVIDSGARKVDDWGYATNQGTVYLASPADMDRERLSRQMFHRVDRAKKYRMPGID